MRIEDVEKVLSNISFSPSNLDMAWEWDVKETKIYDNGVVLEKGFSIRTTFMRPDINSGEIEKGYGRWMYVPENISSDGLVKTGWLCAELIVKHELMESFLYEKKRIFDPHKSLEDLQYNARTVDRPNVEIFKESEPIEPNGNGPLIPESPVKKETVSSEKLFHKQNIENHQSEITKFLNENFKKAKKVSDSTDGYKHGSKNIYHYLDRKGVVISDSNSGKILYSVDGVKYNMSDVMEMCKDIISMSSGGTSDPSDVNAMIHSRGFVDGKSQDDLWVFSNPKNKTRYIVHSEIEKSIAIVNGNNDVIGVVEGNNYNTISIGTLFDKHRL